jgi:hypothetical protein
MEKLGMTHRIPPRIATILDCRKDIGCVGIIGCGGKP